MVFFRIYTIFVPRATVSPASSSISTKNSGRYFSPLLVFARIFFMCSSFMIKGAVTVPRPGLIKSIWTCLIPHDIIFSQNFYQHYHEERICHCIQRTAKMGIHIITIAPSHLHLNDDFFLIGRYFSHDNSRPPVGRVYIYKKLKKCGIHCSFSQ